MFKQTKDSKSMLKKAGTKRQFWKLLTTPADQSRLTVTLPSTYVKRREEASKFWQYDLYAPVIIKSRKHQKAYT